MGTTELAAGNMPQADNMAGANTNFFYEYALDAWQRSLLCLDILRQRGNIYHEHSAKLVPHVLEFSTKLIRDGRTLPRPVNYLLVQILPPKDAAINPAKPPFIIVDPRAGHGPGIGGMKADSEIGMAIRAGHPCYYIGFLPDPVSGQTVEDVCVAEAAFVKEVAELHPDSESRPVIIANCQAGWQIMMMAAMNPDLAGPIMLAGTPLSYWDGVRGMNPMRYLGGMLGGSWLTALAGDMGNGVFDGANLVANFESLNPANTYWEKPYNVYSKVDTEGPRFLDFETWWGSPVLLNAGEMQWIADNLFIGNKLTSGKLEIDGQAIDLRNIRSPIIIFCSWGDNITPPQQALGWITDLYRDEREIVLNGQTIVYTMHQSIGHLGIFVSGKIATKEHQEFTQCMELITMAPPGLYEAVITEVDANTPGLDLIEGKYLFQLQSRTLDDIRAIGANTPQDDQCFSTLARLSEVNTHLYRTFAAPAVRLWSNELSAKAMRSMHPNRLRFSLFSDQNPFMRPVGPLAEALRKTRAPASPDNPLTAIEKGMSAWISATWEFYRTVRDSMTEAAFFGIYGSFLTQRALGIASGPQGTLQPEQTSSAMKRLSEKLEKRFENGELIEAVARSLAYVNRPEGTIDERGFATIRKFREAQGQNRRSLREIKDILTEQVLLIQMDEERAITALPKLLPKNPKLRQEALDFLHEVIAARGRPSQERAERLARIDALFALHAPSVNREADNRPGRIAS